MAPKKRIIYSILDVIAFAKIFFDNDDLIAFIKDENGKIIFVIKILKDSPDPTVLSPSNPWIEFIRAYIPTKGKNYIEFNSDFKRVVLSYTALEEFVSGETHIKNMCSGCVHFDMFQAFAIEIING